MISVIIPVYNEAGLIAESIIRTRYAANDKNLEIIVVDGASTDETLSIAKNCGVIVLRGPKGRAAQMNQGALSANGNILYFLHADSVPPANFTDYILNSVHFGAISGCFRLAFDHDHWFLRANCWFTRFDINGVRFGDQSLFVLKDIFFKVGGFREDLLMMEDQEIIHRLKKNGKFKIMNALVTTSARKYLDNGIYRMQTIFYLIWFLYYMGYSQISLLKLHRKLIRKHKL